MSKLSLVMIVKDEARYIASCLDSVKDIVDEIVVVDTGSRDNTKEIALSYGARLFDFQWIDDFAAARNYALDKSSGEWILVLDADEYIASDCKKDIYNFITMNKAIGRIKIISKFIQDNQVKYSQAYVSRLFPRGVYFEGRIHEQLISNLPRINTKIEVKHEGYFLVDKSDRNLKLLLLELEQKPEDAYILYQIAKQYKVSKQNVIADSYFNRCYNIVKVDEGFRDNLIIDYLYNIIAYGNFDKGLDIIAREGNRLNLHPDFHFVCGLFYMELIFSNINKYINLFPNIEKEYLTCLELGETDKYDSVVGVGSFLAAYNLAILYETTGDLTKAKHYYKIAADYNYESATNRLAQIK